MARVAGPLKSSLNAGQLSTSLKGRVNIKPYYSGAIRAVGLEPVQQSGAKLVPGTMRVGALASPIVRKGVLRVSKSLSYTMVMMPGTIDIWRNDRVKVASVAVAALTAERIPDVKTYGEANTFGIFHPQIWDGLRLTRNPANDADWTVSAWPFEQIPEVDLGGTYAKTDDVWTVYIRWADVDTIPIVCNCTVDGTATAAVQLKNAAGTPTKPHDAVADEFDLFAAAIEDAISALSDFASGVSVVKESYNQGQRQAVLKVTFGGALTGSEYEFSMSVVNTSDASALATHTQVGKTEGEPLISVLRGGFAGLAQYQDRSVYFAPAPRKTAMAMSRTGEYFRLGIDSADDAGGRLEALRTETAEEILHIVDATYLVAFTERAEYFASNRTVKRNEPLNWVRASEIGTRANCRPVLLDGAVYFVSRDGGQLYRTSYDAVNEAFAPTPVNDLNGDLVADLVDMVVQGKRADMLAPRLWLLRGDGRLVLGIANLSQDIPLAAVEYPIAGGGLVKAISVDGQDQLWLTVDRAGTVTEEILDEGGLFQCALAVMTDLTGQASGLAALNGRSVWAEIDGDVHGPYTVTGGVIQTGEASRPATIGLWAPPVLESMPFVRVLANDDVVRRPGKVASVKLYVTDTTSLAIGANGRPARDVALTGPGDTTDGGRAGKTGHVTVTGLIGATMEPTLTITQVRPGRLQVRDYIPGVKL